MVYNNRHSYLFHSNRNYIHIYIYSMLVLGMLTIMEYIIEFENHPNILRKSTIIKTIIAQIVLLILCTVLVWFFGWSIHNIGVAIRKCATQPPINICNLRLHYELHRQYRFFQFTVYSTTICWICNNLHNYSCIN